MTTAISVAQQNAHADLEADAVDAGGAAGYVEVRSGAQPASVATAASGTLLATITLNFPAYDAAGATTAGVADLDVTPEPASMWLADHTGNAWFRVFTSAATAIRDGDLGALTSVTGNPVAIIAGSITMPGSA